MRASGAPVGWRSTSRWRRPRAVAVACAGVVLGVAATGGSASRPPAPRGSAAPTAAIAGYGAPVSEQQTPAPGAVNELEAGRPGETKRAAGSFIVALAPGQDPHNVAASIARDYGGKPGAVYDEVIDGFQFIGPDHAGRQMASDPRVRTVHPDYIAYTAETSAVRHLRADNAPCVTACPSPAWYTLPHRGAGVRVGILDTGADLSHPDIANNIDRNASTDASGGVCHTKNGTGQDFNGHGTRTTSNAVGAIGVAPDATAVVVKVFPGSGTRTTFAAIACGLDYLVHLNRTGDNIVAVNASIAGSGPAGSCADGGLRQAVCRLVHGTDTFDANNAPIGGQKWPVAAFFAAAGNSGGSASGVAPARYPETIAVSAFDCDSIDCITSTPRLAYFSNRGSEIDLGAPGVAIYSARRGGGHQVSSGTSRSSPQATGAAADLVSAGVRPDQLRAALQAGGRCPTSTRTKNSAGNCTTGRWSSDPDGSTEPFLDVAVAITAPASQTATAPGAPTNVAAVAGNGQATVSWTAAAANGSPISAYTVSSSPDGRTATVDGTTNSATVVDLRNGTPYTFTVRATNGVGTGPTSVPSNSITPGAPTVPGTPTEVNAVAGNAQATVSWSAPPDGGSPISSYTVTSIPDGRTATVAGTSNSATVTSLRNGVAYTFTVRATNGVGAGPASTPSNQVTPAAFSWTRVEDGGPGVSYSRGWSRYSSSCASGGKYVASRSAGTTATFSFTGTGVRFITAVARTLGNAAVWVDGEAPTTVRGYASGQACNLVGFERTGLAPGPHVLHVRVLGTKDTGSSGYHVVVDAFEYEH